MLRTSCFKHGKKKHIVCRVGSVRDFDSFRLSTAQPAVSNTSSLSNASAASTTSTLFECFGRFDYFNTLRMIDRFDTRGLRH